MARFLWGIVLLPLQQNLKTVYQYLLSVQDLIDYMKLEQTPVLHEIYTPESCKDPLWAAQIL